MQTEDERAEAEVAEEKRRALRASLERERDGYKTRGLDERAAQVEEQLRLLGSPAEASSEPEPEPDGSEQQAQAAPRETAVESKLRRTAGRGKQGE